MAYTEFTLWLLPSEPLRATLRASIEQLASRLDAAPFEPHVTIFCGPSNDAEARAATDRIAREFGPIALTAEGLQATERFTKTLFVQFGESAEARRMFETARASYAASSAYALSPHLSLLYKKLPVEQQRALRETLDYPKGVYWFDRIRIIETELPIEDSGPVTRWRVVTEAALAGTVA